MTNPAFDPKTAKAVEPRRDEATARTVAYEQPLPDGTTALFTATGSFIGPAATAPAPAAANDEAAKLEAEIKADQAKLEQIEPTYHA